MTNVFEEFKRYMRVVMEQEYNPDDIRHVTYRNIFEAGWDALEALRSS